MRACGSSCLNYANEIFRLLIDSSPNRRDRGLIAGLSGDLIADQSRDKESPTENATDEL